LSKIDLLRRIYVRQIQGSTKAGKATHIKCVKNKHATKKGGESRDIRAA
jgi:hypothetical protein